MEIRKLLMADASAEFCGTLAGVLGSAYELRICHDGVEAITLLETFCPDILLMDLMLPGLDGIAVLKSLSSSASRPAVLVTTRYSSPYIESTVGALGVDYLMMKPCDLRALADRIHDMAAGTQPHLPAQPDPQAAVANMLLTVRFSAKWKGFQYLEAAVALYAQDPGQSVTKLLYPAVAKQFNTSAHCVERSIRTAIQTAWDHRDEKLWRLYFTPCRDGSLARPTNTAFIATLARHLQERCAKVV